MLGLLLFFQVKRHHNQIILLSIVRFYAQRLMAYCAKNLVGKSGRNTRFGRAFVVGIRHSHASVVVA